MAFALKVQFAAMLVALMAITSGCAVVQIPSYRLEECAAESYASPPVILPSMPAMPMPGWLARWKAEKDLPKPPEAPRFHPLPTRPMFQPRPANDFVGAPGESACYGLLPDAQSWNGVEAVPPHFPSPATPPPQLPTPAGPIPK